MTEQITLDEALKLVDFELDFDGTWFVKHVKGDCYIVKGNCNIVEGHCNTVKGNCDIVKGNCGTVEGNDYTHF